MILSTEEKVALDSAGPNPLKIWRFLEPPVEIGSRHTSDGEFYTVMDKRRLTAAEVMKTQTRPTFKALQGAWPEGVAVVWLIVVLKGDHTDRPRLLRWGGSRFDYTERSDLAMNGDADPGEGLSAEETEFYTRKAHEAREAELMDKSVVTEEAVLRELAKPGLTRTERKKWRYVLHSIRLLRGGKK